MNGKCYPLGYIHSGAYLTETILIIRQIQPYPEEMLDEAPRNNS